MEPFLELWHTTSVWHGPVLPGEYGTYTAKTTIPLWEY
jgi:hypothetical protein